MKIKRLIILAVVGGGLLAGMRRTNAVGDGGTTLVNRNEGVGFTFKSVKNGQAAVEEYLKTNPNGLLPNNFAVNSELKRTTRDQNDRFLTERGFNLKGEHFFYQQKIKGVPVYGAKLAVHLKNGSEIYSLSGNVVNSDDLPTEKITGETAKQRALEAATRDGKSSKKLKVVATEKNVLNKKILGAEEDVKNYNTLRVTVASDQKLPDFVYKYFVDLETGNIVYSEPVLIKALNRYVYDCTSPNPDGSCPLGRMEGGPPVGKTEVDNAYSFLGNTYNYFKNNYGRDSYDNNGAALRSFVSVSDALMCPNAFWAGNTYGYFLFCTGLVANDVLAHEYSHAVTENSADLIYQYQSGAMNESVSDIFAYALDNDWTMGEDTILGIIRYLDDPTRGNPPQPDRLFSNYYYCPTGTPGPLNDYGGVHYNSGVLNKAFYLMTAGGNFNGCNITGVTKEKSHPIIYRALTTYLTSAANFKEAYTAIGQACTDLYQAGSNTCTQVANAMKAVEMDQQPDGQQQGAKCLGRTPATPQCNGSTPNPTASPTKTPTPTASKTPTPTLTPTTMLSPTPTVFNCDNECPSDFECYYSPKYNEYRWFVTGYVMADFEETTAPDCGGVAKPTFKGKAGADANCDGYIDGSDYSIWRGEYMDRGASGNVGRWEADFTGGGDGRCNGYTSGDDYSLWRRQYLDG